MDSMRTILFFTLKHENVLYLTPKYQHKHKGMAKYATFNKKIDLQIWVIIDELQTEWVWYK